MTFDQLMTNMKMRAEAAVFALDHLEQEGTYRYDFGIKNVLFQRVSGDACAVIVIVALNNGDVLSVGIDMADVDNAQPTALKP